MPAHHPEVVVSGAYSEDLPVLRRYWRVGFGETLRGRTALVVGDLRAIRAAAEAGLGITVLPRYLCDLALPGGRLVALHHFGAEQINVIHLPHRVRPSGDTLAGGRGDVHA